MAHISLDLTARQSVLTTLATGRLSKDGSDADGESEERAALDLASSTSGGSGGRSSAGSGGGSGASDGSEGGGTGDGDNRRALLGVRVGSASSSGRGLGSGDEGGSGGGLGGILLVVLLLRVLDLELLGLSEDAGAAGGDGLEVELEGRVIGDVLLGDDDGALGQVNLTEVLGEGGVAAGHVDEDEVSGLGVGADGVPLDGDAGSDIDNVVLLGVGDLDGQSRGGEEGLEEGGGGTHFGGCFGMEY